jgi:fatty acid desaturase
MYKHTSSNNAEKAPSTASAVVGGVIALLAVLALMGAFCVAFCAFPAVLPLWSLWIAGGVALAAAFAVGFKAVFID